MKIMKINPKTANRRVKAVFTVEAAVIVPLTLMIVTSLLIFAYYLRDRAVIGSESYRILLDEATAGESAENIADTAEAYISERLFSASAFTAALSSDENYSLKSDAEFSWSLAFMRVFMGEDAASVSKTVNVYAQSGRETLLKYKLIKEGVKSLKDGSVSNGDEF